ncbi:Na+/H+ antiporter NhaA [Georgenia sp. SUBG003]|uniref:Na+/H+ antiporter NhaA n=1 Tax=Georgenia sp. SUBG003 TaxID=1497974 RepID=UPI003AB59EB2
MAPGSGRDSSRRASGPGRLLGGAALSGIGFTVALLIIHLAFETNRGRGWPAKRARGVDERSVHNGRAGPVAGGGPGCPGNGSGPRSEDRGPEQVRRFYRLRTSA